MNPLQKFLSKQTSISSTIAVITFIGGTLFAFIIAGISYQIQHIDATEDFLNSAHRITDQMGLFTGIFLEKKDYLSLQKTIEQSGREEGIEFIAILDRGLNVIASNRKELIGFPVSKYPGNLFLSEEIKIAFTKRESEVIFSPEKNLFEVISSIPSPSKNSLDYVLIITFLDKNVLSDSKTRFWSYLRLALGLTAIAMVILYFLLRRIVSLPLSRLIHATERLGRGELGIQIPVDSFNEIGRLTDTFNQVSDSLATQQNALKASEERYLHIFHFFPLPLILMDSEGFMINVNSVYLSQTKSPFYLKDWEEKSVLNIPLIQLGGLQTEIRHLLENGNPFKLSKFPIALPGKQTQGFFNISGIPLFEDQNQLTGAILAIEDITLQQNLENQLIQSQKLESLGILSGGIAHDFNNILTGILGYTQLLREQLPPDAFSQKALKVIEKSSFRARDLIQQMIGFARWHPLAKSKIEVNSFVSRIAALFQKTLEKEITIQAELVQEPSYIFADEDQLHQALLNLCINARDAIQIEGGKILLKTDLKMLPLESDPSSFRNYIEITIQDNGVGMESEVLGHIFEPFFTTKDVGKGTGLGLSVTYGIVKANDGKITVASEPGKGTAFTLQFPLV